jgi:adenylate kinase
MNIIVNGPQGSGKSTQAKLIADKYNLNLVDSGDALRHIPDEKLEAELKSFMDKGEWIPEQLYFKVFDAFVAKNFDKNKGFVLTGVPRTLSQIPFLENHVGIKIDHLVNLVVSPEVFWERMNLRKKLEGRSDDSDQAIKERLEEYKEKTLPVVEHYRALGKVMDINGEGTIEVIFAEIEKELHLRK